MKKYVQKLNIKPHRKGKIIPNGVKLEPHEYSTVIFLTSQGFNVEIIAPSNTPHAKNADIFMLGLVWEMKCPQGSSRYCIERLFRKATHQAENLIFDLRITKLSPQFAESIIKKLFASNRHVRRLLIITKRKELTYKAPYLCNIWIGVLHCNPKCSLSWL